MSKSDQVDRTDSTNKPTDAQLDPAKQQVEPSPAPKVESASSLTNPGPDRKNALKHGAYSREIVLPWESAEEFDAMLQANREDLNPEGAMQESCVEQITQLQWLKRRVILIDKISTLTDPFTEELVRLQESEGVGIEQFIREAREIPSGKMGPIALNPQEQKVQLARVRREMEQSGKIPPRSSSDDEAAPQQPATGTDRTRHKKVLERLLPPGEIDRFLKTLGSIDARIDKAFGRLVVNKEYQLRYGKKTISHQGDQPTN